MAGTVKSRKSTRHATSDWMNIEQERGISVTTSVMKFAYKDFEINFLDTPGHQDFSEDTYRVLTAVDSALVVIDSAKGVEPQTIKLMDVCRMRQTPIMTFINKLDREGLSPLDLMADVEKTLKIECVPMTWPIGMGKRFQGTYNLYNQSLRLFSSTENARITEGILITDLNDPRLDELLGTQADELREDIELLEGAANRFEKEAFLSGEQTPLFFGSAINNFGVQELLDALVELAPPPGSRKTTTRDISPYEEIFSGMVFKIQANMNPAHRDRIAFLRICSGKFTQGMKMRHHRSGKDIQVSNPIIFMSQGRSTVEEAYAGDIIGIPNHGTIRIGDTFTVKEPLKFTGIPHFAPEHFQIIRIKNALKMKQLQKGVTQLAEEGVVQFFRPLASNDYILGAVGVLQFDVIKTRIKYEYGVDAYYTPVRLDCARWISCDDPQKLQEFEKKFKMNLALDAGKNLIYLSKDRWSLNYTMEQWPQISFHETMEKH